MFRTIPYVIAILCTASSHRSSTVDSFLIAQLLNSVHRWTFSMNLVSRNTFLGWSFICLSHSRQVKQKTPHQNYFCENLLTKRTRISSLTALLQPRSHGSLSLFSPCTPSGPTSREHLMHVSFDCHTTRSFLAGSSPPNVWCALTPSGIVQKTQA